MKVRIRFLCGLFILAQIITVSPVASKPELSCGDTITENTLLSQDLACPPGTASAIIIGASNITLDLGGHELSGDASGVGVFAVGYEGITIKNGTIEGFHDGIFIINTNNVIMKNLTVRNLTDTDPDHFFFGIHIENSQNVYVKDALFEFPVVFHKEAVEIFGSSVTVDDIDVHGGGAGVNFSFAGEVCDPIDNPNTGIVRNSRFSQVRGAGVIVACSNHVEVIGNTFTSGLSGLGVGIYASGPSLEAVTGLIAQGNVINGDHYIGIDFGGANGSLVSNNIVSDNYLGIAMRPSLGCLTPETGWDCFYTTANTITDNQAFRNGTDLYHDENSTGNTWEGNTCETKDGADIPECTPPTALLTINYPSGKPGSFFTLKGANFPSDSTATIVANGFTLGTVPTDSLGDLIFLLNTEQADNGDYVVTATVDTEAPARFVLDPSQRIRLQEGSGPVFNLPGGLITHFVYLPLIFRR